MAIYEYETRFFNLNIETYQKKDGINPDKAVKIEVDYDASENGEKIKDRLLDLVEDPKVGELKALIIGPWEDCYEEDCGELVEEILASEDKLTSLTALFVGDITMEDAEISWIQQDNYARLWKAFPKLECFRVRGGEGLSLGEIEHAKLKTLTIETGGLPENVLQQVIDCELPELEHLELWLGESNYGWSSSAEDVKPILRIEKFPKLKTLALRNSEIADEIAKLVSKSEMLDVIEVLDLSMGTLSDDGAKALLDSGKLERLKRIDLHYHYLSDEMMEKLKALPVEVNLDDAQGVAVEDDRYVSCGE